ncbi:MAG: STAS domain-containing protein [Desulfobacterales bacterium]|nr:STAS domain-containing protein [Desulfobacterales bacterium]
MNTMIITEQDNCVIATIPPDLTQHDYLEMREYFNDHFFTKGKNKLVINCEAVTDLPSIAFGVFCSLTRDTRRLGGTFSLVHVGNALRKTMARTHIDKQLNIVNTLTDAMKDERV